MWQRENTWKKYVKNIIAADVSSAVFLASYMRHTTLSRSYTAALEVIDLQRYKVITQKNKVRAAMSRYASTPFVFFVGKN